MSFQNVIALSPTVSLQASASGSSSAYAFLGPFISAGASIYASSPDFSVVYDNFVAAHACEPAIACGNNPGSSASVSATVPVNTPIRVIIGASTSQTQYEQIAGMPGGFSGQASASATANFAPFMGSITTNQFASPCINSTSCNANSMISGPTNISGGDLLIGTGGGTGTLTVGPATLTTTSLTLGGSSEGDATVQSGGTIQTGTLTVGNATTTGSLTVQGGGSVTATSTAVGQNGSIALTGQGAVLNAGNSLTLDANSGNSVSIGTGASLLIGTATGQGLDVGSGGTLQFNLAPFSSATISTAAPVTVEKNGTILATPSTDLIDLTTGKFLVGTGAGYQLITGTSSSGSELQALAQSRSPANYSPPQQTGGYWIGQLGSGSIKTPILATDYLQSNNNLISTFLIPTVIMPTVSTGTSNVSNGSLVLAPETLTYRPSTLAPRVGLPAIPVSTTQEYTLATIAANQFVNLSGLTITSAVRMDQQQAQVMLNELNSQLAIYKQEGSCGAQCPIPTPGSSQNQVWAYLFGAGLNPSDISGSVSTLLQQTQYTNSLVNQYRSGSITQNDLLLDITSKIDNLSSQGLYASNHLKGGMTQGVDVLVPIGSAQSAINTALSLGTAAGAGGPYVTKVGCNTAQFTSCKFFDSPPPPAGYAGYTSLHFDLKNSGPADTGPPLVAINTPSGFTGLANNFQTTVVAANETLFGVSIDPANVAGFIFNNGTSGLYFTSVELFEMPSYSTMFDIYVDNHGQWVFEAMSAGNYPYTFSEFGGVDAFEILFINAMLPSDFNNLLVDVTFDSGGNFNGTLTPLLAGSSATPLPAALPLFATGLGVLGLLGWRRKRKAAAIKA